jgi:hypothetical protein
VVDEALDARYFQRSPERHRVFYPFGLEVSASGPISYGATVSRISQTSLEAPGFSKSRLAG